MLLAEITNRRPRPAETPLAGAAPRPETSWYRALMLTERAAPGPVGGAVPAGAPRRQRWGAIPGLADEQSFRSRLAAEGIPEGQFDRALAEAPEALRARWPQTPAWLAEVLDAYATDPAPGNREALPGDGLGALLALVHPLVLRGQRRVRDGVGRLACDYPAAPFDPGTVEPMLHAHLAGGLTRMIARTAVLEMHVARLEGRLDGETSAARFLDFVRHLGEPAGARRLLAEYPVLARLVAQAVDRWVAASLEFLEHLGRDAAALRDTLLGGEDPGRLAAIASGAGDAHRGGRSVRLLRFTSGRHLVYKPRSLSVDRHFGELLAWLNGRRGELPPFRVLRTLDRGDHGWVEYVEHLPCQTADEVGRFYVRQGMNLAVLHALGASDFHDENLIASGEDPVLVDLECLLAAHEARAAEDLAWERAARDLDRSVLAVGLLPCRAWAGPDSDGIDLSGLGTAADQLTPTSLPIWDGIGTDAMHLQRRRVPFAESSNRPTLAGRKASVRDHAGAFIDGFTAMYRLLGRHRDDLLAPRGPLARFADDPVRVILRPTATYGLLLAESYHPDVLRDALDRDRLFDRLWTDVRGQPGLARVFARERADLWDGDIPSFTTRPGSLDLWDSRGGRITDFFARCGMDLLCDRLNRFDEGDLERQLWYVRASLSTLAGGGRHAAGAAPRRPAAAGDATRERLLAAARAVGDRLGALAVSGGDDATWNGLVFAGNRHPSVAPLRLDLYEGLPGVTLFLAQLGAVTGEERFTALARAGLATQLRWSDSGPIPIASVGAYSGLGGLIYELTRLAALWARDDLRRRAEALAETLPPLIERDDQLDVIAGSAGCLGCLLALYHLAPSARTLAVARLCGARLLAAAARVAEPGLAWPVPGMGDRPLAGFSHGNAGIAWALLGLWAVTREERYRITALDALTYERSLFRADAGNWLDLRPREPGEDAGTAAFMTAWCHGAPGIGLARLGRLPQMDDATVRAEIEAAVRTTVAYGFGANHSLCHGDLGNLELLIQARRTLGDVRLDEPLARGAAAVLEGIEQGGWRCGVPQGVETPGLMTGLAGIGYGLLRLAEPERVPSVLLLGL